MRAGLLLLLVPVVLVAQITSGALSGTANMVAGAPPVR